MILNAIDYARDSLITIFVTVVVNNKLGHREQSCVGFFFLGGDFYFLWFSLFRTEDVLVKTSAISLTFHYTLVTEHFPVAPFTMRPFIHTLEKHWLPVPLGRANDQQNCGPPAWNANKWKCGQSDSLPMHSSHMVTSVSWLTLLVGFNFRVRNQWKLGSLSRRLCKYQRLPQPARHGHSTQIPD